MGGRQVKPDIDYQQYEEKWKPVAQDCQAGPVEQRSCKDICCLVTFVIFTLAFIVIGMYFIVNIDSGDFQRFRDQMANASSSSNNSSTKKKASLSGSVSTLQKHFSMQRMHDEYEGMQHRQVSMASGQFPDLLEALPWIIFMSIFSLVLSLVLVIAISKIPKIIIYSLIVLTFLLILGGIVGGFLIGLVQLSIVCFVFGLIWGLLITIMFCCYREQFEAAIVLLKVTGNFLREKPSVLLAPIFVMFVSYFYFAFWLISFIAIQLDRQNWSSSSNNSSTSTSAQYHADYHDFISIFWLFINVFYSYFLYYVMVFLIATATALWYFSIEGNFILKGLSYIWNAHIGSLTFASLIVTIINMLKSSADNHNNSQNAFAACCSCFVRLCFSFLEEIIKVLNHNAVIVMSVTGQDFIDSAKSAIYLIYNNFGLFVAIDMVEFLLKVCVLFLTILLPTGLGLLLLKLTYSQGPNQEDAYLIISALIIIVICLLISLLTITVLSEALSCIFIFYCMDERFKSMNFGAVNRVPANLRGLFNQIQYEGRNVNAENLYEQNKENNHY